MQINSKSEAARLMAKERWKNEKPDIERLTKIGRKGGLKNKGKKRGSKLKK